MSNYDLSCLVPVLEAGAKIPGFGNGERRATEKLGAEVGVVWSGGFEFANDNTLEEQAEWTIEALNNMQEWGTVWLAFIWNFNYAPQAGWDPSNDNVPYSMIGKDWNFRPVYGSITEWAQEYNTSIGQ